MVFFQPQNRPNMPNESNLKSLLSEVSDSLQLRIEKLTAQYTENKSQQSEEITSLSRLLQAATQEVEELQKWRSEADRKLGNLN